MAVMSEMELLSILTDDDHFYSCGHGIQKMPYQKALSRLFNACGKWERLKYYETNHPKLLHWQS